jgi:hypothetical protein
VFLWQRGLAELTPDLGLVGNHDLVAYWSGARLLRNGSDPYDPTALLVLEQSVGWPEDEPVRVWNPPWMLTLLLPLAYLPFPLATAVWFLVQFGLILSSGVLLWRYYAPEDNRYWVGLVLAASFTPGLFALRIGQVSVWLLVGVVGFLYGVRSQRNMFAGVALALLMIKPHMTYLLWPVALWWGWKNRHWQILIGWIAALVVASAVPMLFLPSLLMRYQKVVTGPPLDWVTPTLGSWLRIFLGIDGQWVQLVPTLLAGLGLIVWLRRRRGAWYWDKITSPLLLASALTAPFGWTFDWLVLLPVAVDLVARVRSVSSAQRVLAVGFLAMFQLALYLQSLLRLNYLFDFWYPLGLTGLYWWTLHHLRVPKYRSPNG